MTTIGRFAPSPTGPLHLGSLVAAVASWLYARADGGRWLVRMEDIDTPRVVRGSAEEILAALRRYGLEWDGEVVVQSQRTALYERALRTLRSRGLVYDCGCSRAELQRAASAPAGSEALYPGTCRNGLAAGKVPRAIRFKAPDEVITFDDRVAGHVEENVARATGDFVVRRADGLFAYQLAVVVDDAEQGVTQVVRGADLLASTARQIALQRALGYPMPSYAHVPLVVNPDGSKLGKRDGALPLPSLDESRIRETLGLALTHLGIHEIESAAPREMLDEALQRFRERTGPDPELGGSMNNEITRNEKEQRFEMKVDGSTAYVEYELEPESIVFTHTTVPSELEGRGIGKQLAQHVLEYAKTQNLKVVPQCAFIASYIKRNPEYQELVRSS